MISQVHVEDAQTNKLVEAKNLLEEMRNHWVFRETTFFLCLNKKDLFESKIKDGYHLKTHFPE